MKHMGLNQLLCAAVVNSKFRETLLRSPAQAIASGYLEHSFSLTPEEEKLVTGIQARQLEDFAEQIYRWISGNGKGVRHKVLGSGEPFPTQSSQRNTGNDTDDNGYKQRALDALDPFVELHRAPVLVEA